MEEEEERAVTSRDFSYYGQPLDMVTSFRYLGRVISAADDDWTVVFQNLVRAREVWKTIKRILIREGAEPAVSVFFFKYMVQAVLLFVAETWVVTPLISKVLGAFQDQMARRLTGRLPQRQENGKWKYTLAATAREEVGFEMTEECIWR